MSELATAQAPAEAPAPRRRPARGAVPAVAWPVLGLALAVFAWWLAARLAGLPEVVLPPPQSVLSAFLVLPAYLVEQTWVTARLTLVGFALAVVGGVFIGVAIAGSRWVERMVSPLLVAFNAVPKIALAPLLFVWLELGERPIIAMTFLICFFPIVLSTAAGLLSTPADLVELARSLDASRWQAFVKVRLPAALPQIFVGLKVAMPLAVIGAVVGEMQGGEMGLGTVIVQTSGQGDSATAFAAIVLLSLVSILLYYALVGVERLLLPWVRATAAAR
ncbi:ABC transporter permease [Spirilliplanes yamanashiensis]|uniref:ABC transporter permease n=1 Tax=Spirilliplanes yamanashiensis TaxID=42233 RepID=A0A8J3Y8W8_9ACTN|nr:ABC transporter permease [Spirilliplanes yamanashiensis]MDP9815905.1 NitT/TauT family transport system permease protein [Spirilliplanes yamanashiensis]GIJ04161.1 ABC transporter permease [Spirilliplanes yamanashiensis]